MSAGDINKWADSRDPGGTAARGRRGNDTSLLSRGFCKEGLDSYTVPCFALPGGTGKCRDTESGKLEQGWLLLGRMMANRRVGMKENQALCP